MVTGYTIGSYRLGQTLGVGTFGKVKLAVHEGTDLNVAVKIVNKMKMQSMDMHEKVRREIAILQCLHHPHVIRLYELIDTPTDIFMAMEYVPGGELFDYIVQHSRLQEPEARKFFQQIVSGVEYCHHHAVCHRDLKPENILLDANLNVKVGDFGLSNFMRYVLGATMMMLDAETGISYARPADPPITRLRKLFRARPEVDVWSCAVILYALLCGSLPFDDEHVPNLFKKIKHGNFTLPGHLSEQSRSLIVRMLAVDPVKRITFKEIRRHPWFRANLPPSLSSSTSLRMAAHTGIDMSIVEEMVALGYTVDPDTLVIHPKAGTFPSRTTVAYQLLADRRANERFASFGENAVRHPPFAFSRESQKRAAAAAMVVGPDITPFHWATDNCFTLNQSGTFVSTVSPLGGSLHAAASTPTGYLTQRGGLAGGGQVSPLSRPPYSGGSSMDWSPGSPMWTASRWKLGIESSLESAIIVTAILNTLKALNYEWRLVTPFKICCRALRKGGSQDLAEEFPSGDEGVRRSSFSSFTATVQSSSVAAAAAASLDVAPSAVPQNSSGAHKQVDTTSLTPGETATTAATASGGTGHHAPGAEPTTTARHRRHSTGARKDLTRAASHVSTSSMSPLPPLDGVAKQSSLRNTPHQSPSSVMICIQLFKLFDGPTLRRFSPPNHKSIVVMTCVASVLYSTKEPNTQTIQLQDSPGSALPIWSPSTPILLGAGPLMAGSQQGLFG